MLGRAEKHRAGYHVENVQLIITMNPILVCVWLDYPISNEQVVQSSTSYFNLIFHEAARRSLPKVKSVSIHRYVRNKELIDPLSFAMARITGIFQQHLSI